MIAKDDTRCRLRILPLVGVLSLMVLDILDWVRCGAPSGIRQGSESLPIRRLAGLVGLRRTAGFQMAAAGQDVPAPQPACPVYKAGYRQHIDQSDVNAFLWR